MPLEQCPWCGTPFSKSSFRLVPNSDEPKNLTVRCAGRRCEFNGKRHLPIVAVDEPIYDRLPGFMIATADKFAALPWSGETARFFRGGDPDNPRPPDLIIQDELHLISGPLGTMAGLYETAIDHLCKRWIGGREVRPKVIASTATVRLAKRQIRALFNRQSTEVFPAPGVDRRNSFFAEQVPESRSCRASLSWNRGAGPGPKGGLPAQHYNTDGRSAGSLEFGRPFRAFQSCRPLYDHGCLFQCLAGARRFAENR